MPEQRTDQQYVENHSAEYMAPVQGVMTKARVDIMSHVDDFTAAGIDARYADLVATKASDRAKSEYEAMQAEDPLVRVANILRESASSEQDKYIVEESIKDMEKTRSAWQATIDADKIKAEYSHEQFDLQQKVTDLRQWNIVPSFMETLYGKHYPYFEVLSGIYDKRQEAMPSIYPSIELATQVLHKLGALDPSRSIDTLSNIPEGPDSWSSPTFNRNVNKVSHLSTSMEGVKATVFLDKARPRITIGVDLGVLEKITNLPPSI